MKQRIKDVLEITAYVVFIAFVLMLAYFAIHGAHKLSRAASHFSSRIDTTLDKLDSAADTNIEHVTNELKETQKATAAAKDFFDHTDLSVNGRHHDGLIPQATTLLVKAQPLVDTLAASAKDLDTAILNLNALFLGGTATLSQIQASLAGIDKLTQALELQTTDPAIKDTLEHLDTAVRSAAVGMTELAASATDVRQIADKARDTYLKPVNLWWGLVKELLPLAGSAAQVVK